MSAEGLDTFQKARQINHDAAVHGTFAEIGAGQEVARWFFHVGGAASTVAKTVSAYDMAVSDELYGPTDRYVSRHRLQAMLDAEYTLLLARLNAARGATTRFFAFADTVVARSYAHRADGQGWMGVRVQPGPQTDPGEILLHVWLPEPDNVREQEALGILGVNLLYGVVYHHDDPVTVIRSLMDGLTRERLEIDLIRFSGAGFAGVDNRLMSLQLVEQAFTDAALFTAAGEVVQAAEILYKKPVLIERGSFRPITHLTLDILEQTAAQYRADSPGGAEPPVILMEMSLRNLLAEGAIDHTDFLARVDILGALSKTVMISNFPAHYQLAEYLRRYTAMPLVFAMGLPNLAEVFNETYYAALDGGILAAFGRLFKAGVRLYVYPAIDRASGNLVTADTLQVPPDLRHLQAHLREHHLVVPIAHPTAAYLPIVPREVLARIQAGDASWETMVPAVAVQLIKDRRLFQREPLRAPSSTPAPP